jgi:hypothetical protein
MTDHIAGSCWDLPPQHVETWARSIRDTGFRGESHLFAYDPSSEIESICSRHSVKLHELRLSCRTSSQLSRETYHQIAQWISSLGLYTERVIVSDVSDLYFQSNPIDWLNQRLSTYEMVLSSLSITFEKAAQISSSIIAGRARTLRLFCEEICSRWDKNASSPPIQVILNSLLTTTNNWRALTTTEADNWTCHGELADHPARIIPPPIVINDKVCTPYRIPYVAVHQYDRVEAWRALSSETRVDKKIASPAAQISRPLAKPSTLKRASPDPSARQTLLGKSIVITTGSMNRASSLRQSLSSWMRLGEISRIIVVDWGSRTPLSREISDLMKADRRIVVARTEQSHWQNSRCHNLEVRLAQEFDLLLRLDNDAIIRPDFFDYHPVDDSSFWAGHWKDVPKEIDDKRNLAGTLLIAPRRVLAVGGYNERLIHYGREDDDLYDRLASSGLKRRDIVLDVIEHIPHTDRARYENLLIKPQIENLIESSRQPVSVTAHLIEMSDRIIASQPWSARDHRTQWRIHREENNYWICTERSQ